MSRDASALLLFAALAASCAPQRPARFVQQPAPQVIEVVTSEDERRSAVIAAPTEFIVPAGDDIYAWQRTLFFFDTYTPGKSVREQGGSTLVTSRPAATGGGFVYKVLREPERGGMRYRVRCVPANGSQPGASAEQNSRNLSRFIREGELELSLLRQ